MRDYFNLGMLDHEAGLWRPPQVGGPDHDPIRWWYREGWRHAQAEATLKAMFAKPEKA